MTGNIATRINELQAIEYLLRKSPQFKQADSLIQRAIENIRRGVGDLETLIEREKEEAESTAEVNRDRATCEHEWHHYGTVNGAPDYGCQKCGASRS